MQLGQEVINEESIEFFAIKISDGIYDRNIKVITNNAVSYENHDQHLMLADKNNASGFGLYTAEGGAFGTLDQQLVGGWYYGKSIESQCDITDEECLNRYQLELNTLKNDSKGISFRTRLDSDVGNFLDIQVSATISPFEPTESNSE
jgi:hypothetical protein